MTAEAQISTILEINQGADEHGIGAEDGGILGLHRQLLSLKLKVQKMTSTFFRSYCGLSCTLPAITCINRRQPFKASVYFPTASEPERFSPVESRGEAEAGS